MSQQQRQAENQTPLKAILEAAMMAAGAPLSLDRMQSLFEENQEPTKDELKDTLAELQQDLEGRGIECIEVASGYRLQVRSQVAPWVAKLWEEKPQRYSRALLETLVLIAYRQPITRGDIEDVRGVVVSSNIIRTLIEREWVRVVGHRETPGRPALYATTKEFLDYFSLKSLDELPTLMEIKELEDLNRKLELGDEAEAKKEPAQEYDFSATDDAERVDVLLETEDDLAQAADIVARVESNLFGLSEADRVEAETEKDIEVNDVLTSLRSKHNEGTLESAQEKDDD